MLIAIAIVISVIVIARLVEAIDKNHKKAITAERMIAYLNPTDPVNIRYWVDRLMTEEELAASILYGKKQLSVSKGAIELVDFPIVSTEDNVGTIEQGRRTYEFRVVGSNLQIIERGSRGSMRETVINYTALLRVLAYLHLIKEKRNGRNKPTN